MSRKLIAFLAATLVIAPLWGCGSNRDSGGGGSTVQTPNQVIATASFVGSTRCLSCHNDKSNWGHTLHKAVLRAPMDFSAAQANTESFYAGTINKGLLLSLGTASGGLNDAGTPDGEFVAYYSDGSSWKTHYELGLGATGSMGALPATSGTYSLKYAAQISKNGSEYYVQFTNLAGTGTATYKIMFTYGGERNYKQRYVLTGIGASKHISPLQYNDKWGTDLTVKWVNYNGQRWYDLANNALATPTSKDSFDGNCAGCHFTGYQLAKNGAGEEIADAVDDINGAVDFDGDGSMDEINVGCEACHGAGSAHASTQNPAYIINPADLTPVEANMVCGQCHIRGKSIDTFNEFADAPAQAPFPAKLDADGNLMKFRPGLDDLSTFYSFDSGDGSGAGSFTSQYWGGEPSSGDFQASVKHHQQYIDILQGPHSPTGSDPDVPRCYTCHDMHNNSDPGAHQVVTNRVDDGVKMTTANDNDTLCLSCHAGMPGPFVNLTKEDVANMTPNGAFNDQMDAVKKAVTDHTQHYYDPTKVDGTSGGVSRCSKCHMPKTAKSALKYDIHAHTFEVIEPAASKSTSPSAGVPNGCTSCHTAADDAALDALQAEFDEKFPKGTDGHLDETLRDPNLEYIGWAATGHANYADDPFNHWNADGAIPTSCAKCHSKVGFRDWALDGTVDAAAPIGQVLSCGTCHVNGQDPEMGNGNLGSTDMLYDDLATYTALANVVFPSGAALTLNNDSNMCMACHMGRKSKADVDAYVPGSNFGSVNPHYLAAAAVMFGTDAQGGYEYAAKTYAGQNNFGGVMGAFVTCTACHMSGNGKSTHQLVKPAINDCLACHGIDPSQPAYPNVDAGNFKFSGIRSPLNTTDYNGNGNITESLKDEIRALEADLLTDIMTYAANPAGLNVPVVYDDATYPYWFNDTNGNGVVDPGENAFSNAYTAFDTTMIRAAYNYTFSIKEPHGYIHHPDYIAQLLIDSMEDLGTDIVARGYVRP
ncbi:hypothetical protein C2E25_11055 [Geothermobacter hydrogeniphilus]|uniref:Cytochrome c domain-containing protein n=1 Tax=Geothermobacter hydrogeniphilus TaxID=1969733 RepID=A0A2K2H8U0_9BACT|nr:hypothetical protein [Geothermobacter hydrogeniphilus]PNU19725.1 hypothetical protein C2E25_11055 [Geothermobacter hydrogeniphilus]